MKTRKPLSRDRVLTAAIALADERGVQDLTMRKLAKELGVEAMSLYNHVGNKDDLIDGMIDIVFSEIEPPSSGVDWKTAMRNRAMSTREALRRHPWAIGEMEGRGSHGPSNLRIHDAVLGCLRGAGFSLEMTVHAYSMQDAYIYGFALQEKTLGLATPQSAGEAARRRAQANAALVDDYPYLAEIVAKLPDAGYDTAVEFAWGLDLILDGLDRRRRDEASQARPSRVPG